VPASIEAPISHGDTAARRRREQSLSGFLRASAPPREHLGFSRPKPSFSRGDAETRRNAEPSASAGFPVSPCLRERIGFLPDMNTDLSPRREDAKKNIEWGFLRVFASSRLCGFAREIVPASIEAPISHGDTAARRKRKQFLSGFLRASAPPREHPGFLPTETRFLSRRRGDAEYCRAIGFSGFPVSPCLRERIGFLPEHEPGSLAKARRRQEKH
jgi:hypothetical protein